MKTNLWRLGWFAAAATLAMTAAMPATAQPYPEKPVRFIVPFSAGSGSDTISRIIAGGEALTAVLSGETSVYFAPIAPALPHVRSGKLRAIAVTSDARMPQLQEYPTIAESGYPGFKTGNWYGLAVPAKTPPAIVATLIKSEIAALARILEGVRVE